MHYYIVDPQKITQKEFERVQNILYSSLSEYRISGEVVRVTGLRTAQQLVENAFAHEAKTIVAVGDDATLHTVINAVGKREMIIGFIPLVKSELANIFGISDVQTGVKIIASRRIELMDLGRVNNNYFVSKISFGETDDGWLPNLDKTFELKFSVNDQYQGELSVARGVIVNSRDNEQDDSANPTDGNLDLMLLPKLTKWQTLKHRADITAGRFDRIPQTSVLHGKKIEIKSPQGLNLKFKDWVLAKTPATIEVIPKTLKIIVGRNRMF